MGIIVNASEPTLDLILYGDKSNIVSNYLSRQLQNLQPAYNEFSARIHNAMQTSYDYVNDRLLHYGLINQLNQSGVQVIDNYYSDLLTFNQLREANVTMQRWIMSHPEVRQLYLDGNLKGYPDTYINVSGETIGDSDYSYRRVMDGVLQDTENGYRINHYLEDLHIGDKELEHFEKVRILNTYDAIDYILKTNDFDFTM